MDTWKYVSSLGTTRWRKPKPSRTHQTRCGTRASSSRLLKIYIFPNNIFKLFVSDPQQRDCEPDPLHAAIWLGQNEQKWSFGRGQTESWILRPLKREDWVEATSEVLRKSRINNIMTKLLILLKLLIFSQSPWWCHTPASPPVSTPLHHFRDRSRHHNLTNYLLSLMAGSPPSLQKLQQLFRWREKDDQEAGAGSFQDSLQDCLRQELSLPQGHSGGV